MTYSFCVTCNGPDENEGYIGHKLCDKMLDEMSLTLRKHGFDLQDSFWEGER